MIVSMNKSNSVTAAVAKVLELPQEDRMAALKKIKWILETDGGFVRLNERTLKAEVTKIRSQATIFDGRDSISAKTIGYATFLKQTVNPMLLR